MIDATEAYNKAYKAYGADLAGWLPDQSAIKGNYGMNIVPWLVGNVVTKPVIHPFTDMWVEDKHETNVDFWDFIPDPDIYAATGESKFGMPPYVKEPRNRVLTARSKLDGLKMGFNKSMKEKYGINNAFEHYEEWINNDE